jgi:membrane protease YdiL (CAAX protease family)
MGWRPDGGTQRKALGAAYLLTGTLWVPIALHAVVDFTSGLTGSFALEEGAGVVPPFGQAA